MLHNDPPWITAQIAYIMYFLARANRATRCAEQIGQKSGIDTRFFSLCVLTFPLKIQLIDQK